MRLLYRGIAYESSSPSCHPEAVTLARETTVPQSFLCLKYRGVAHLRFHYACAIEPSNF
ncbi:MAG: DUF4278 domain-containing protein [Leptolyngbyaceae cyanobacterium SL_7_1]|nr:DUF4278 domain-containing protein [Leptolyngbyaceae cyanobacterium SL_7_1]